MQQSDTDLIIRPRKRRRLVRKCLVEHIYYRPTQWTNMNSDTTTIPLFSEEHTLSLSGKEEKLFQLLQDVCTHFNLNSQIRVAGGWVRDKLLGKLSDDIDLALDDMTGKVFCERMNEYLRIQGSDELKVGVIKLNPKKSKHLETATFRFMDLDIDMNNLRSEVYDTKSRIPNVEYGSVEEDALRRDFTINSMYYNVRTRKVEDICQTGIQDLKAGVIKTPVDPLQTFRDDPLRVLRAARFAGRFMFKVDEALTAAAVNSDVHQDLNIKVSRPRMGMELHKMMTIRPPRHAGASFELLHAWSLFPIVFDMPVEVFPNAEALVRYNLNQQILEDGDEGPRFPCDDAMTLMQDAVAMLEANVPEVEYKAVKGAVDEQLVQLLGALMLPLHGYEMQKPRVTGKPNRAGKIQAVIEHIVIVSMTYPTKVARATEAVVKAANTLLLLAQRYTETCAKFNGTLPIDAAVATSVDQARYEYALGKDNKEFDVTALRVEVGKVVTSCKSVWPLALKLAFVLELSQIREADNTRLPRPIPAEVLASEWKTSSARALYLWIVDSGLSECYTWKSAVNGKDVGTLCSIKKTSIGMMMSKIKERSYIYTTQTKPEVIAWLQTIDKEILNSVLPPKPKIPQKKPVKKTTAK